MRIFAVALVAVLGLVSQTQGAVVFYTNSAAFSAAAGPGLTVENFDSSVVSLFPATSAAGLGINSPYNFSPFTGIQSTQYGSGQSAMGYPANGAITFTFPAPVTSFGIDMFDLGTQGPTTLTVTLSDGSVANLFVGYSGGIGNQQFAGFVSTVPITFITFSSTASGDFVDFDNAQFGLTAVPEPASMLAWGLLSGVGLVATRLRRRKVAG